MKQAIAILGAALLTVAASVPAMGRTLVAYYSYTGNTESIVAAITNAIPADVVEVQPAEDGRRRSAGKSHQTDMNGQVAL